MKEIINRKVGTSKEVFGFSLNFQMTTLKDIWQKIQKTKVFEQESDTSQLIFSI